MSRRVVAASSVEPSVRVCVVPVAVFWNIAWGAAPSSVGMRVPISK